MIDFANTQYVHDLAVLKSAPTHKLKLIGDQWRTPDALFWGINAMFGPLVLDLFSDGENAKTPAYYTAEDNALTQDWAAKLTELNGAAFANPPYSTAKKHEGQYITGIVPDKLRVDLKAWKQYRIAVKNVDVSLVPDIEWPVVPE
ncbi:DNA N-6-adenine-methyltransferase [Yersinia aldovae]|uniref:Phage tail fiber assembly protein n=1 Tax=Yersinia aldovae TaxID=29483 RepID=A0ABM9STX9_YERAL|nr:DNA N-6-adenine-methyltransferase [Yersinia aldovae]CNJ88554.1 putative phage tail fiber assembly protein [Yersinia aldovae]CNL14128.1 putative phage tail fiber assembly protein [Yersinia aldovae]